MTLCYQDLLISVVGLLDDQRDYIQLLVVIRHLYFCEIAEIIALKLCFRSFVFVVEVELIKTEMLAVPGQV